MSRLVECTRHPILNAKLRRPPVAASFVPRQRLVRQMDLGLDTSLTLVSAPAGYGKTSLVSHWIECRQIPCAWLSLGDEDQDPRVFLTDLLAAIETASPGACQRARHLLDAEPDPRIVARHLINELDLLDSRLAVVLDDYHRIGQVSPVHEVIGMLLEHPPRLLHCVLLTRREPPLPLARARASGRLNEVRLQDLRFTESETADLFAGTGVGIGEQAIGTVERELEGWAAGLHLVLLAARHAGDTGAFLTSQSGELPQLREYLLEEVLAGQPPEVQDSMLKASLLERFCPGVLDVMGASALGGREFLVLLQRDNVFTIALDACGEWFRYHSVFRDLLRDRLVRSIDPDERATLRLRASEWLERHGFVGDAIDQALAAGESARAAEILERSRCSELETDRWTETPSLITRFAADKRAQHPGLLMAEAWDAHHHWELERLASILEEWDARFGGDAAGAPWRGDFHLMAGYLGYWEADGDRARQHLDQARQQIPQGRRLIRGQAELQLALARCMLGERQEAVRALETQIPHADERFASRLLKGLGLVHLLCAEASHAAAAASRLREVALRNGLHNAVGWSAYLLGCAHLGLGSWEESAAHLPSVSDPRSPCEPRVVIDGLSALALTRQLMGQPEGARAAISELLSFANESRSPYYASRARSSQARIALLEGDLESAVTWARSATASTAPADLFVWMEVPALTQARVWLAAGSEPGLNRAAELVRAVRRTSEACAFTGQILEAGVLQSLLLDKRGQAREATEALNEAVTLAEPGGWIRPFLEAGPPMVELLHRLSEQREDRSFIDRVLTAFRFTPAIPSTRAHSNSTVSARARPMPPELDALTHRELDILEFLAKRLQNKEIAGQLYISPHTVNDHLKHVYRKLGVTSRRQAVNRAVEIGILRRPSLG